MAARIDRLDLKMLRVLAALHHSRNTYRAAEQLHLTQSAVSRALGRLRDVLDDPLFVRSADGLEPTEMTERIVARLPELFDMLEEVVQGEEEFDPAAWHGTVRLALGSPVLRASGAEICERLSAQAPNVLWHVETWGANTVNDILDGRLAFGVHFSNMRWPQGLFQAPLGSDEYILMAREGHPAGRRRPTLSVFEKYPLISLLLPDWNDYDNRLEALLRGQGVDPRVLLRTDNLALALERLLASDALMAGTRSLVKQMPGLKALAYPLELELPDDRLVMCYPRRLRNSPRYQWLAGEVKDLLSGMSA